MKFKMALSLKLLICLLFVARVFSEGTNTIPTTTESNPLPSTSAKPENVTTNSTEGGTTTVPTTTKTPGPCDSNPCKGGSTCENRANNTHVCLCPSGKYYQDVSCVAANVIPGELTYNTEYKEEMTNKASPEFKETADAIVDALKQMFNKDKNQYINSTVIRLRAVTLTRATGVNAIVDIIFDKESKITPTDVENEIKKDGPALGLEGFVGCACDKNTTECKATETGTKPFTCECADAFITTPFSDLICIACPGGEKASNGICVLCDFGYSGFNCEEDWQLILVIVGSVLGALLLISLILLPVVATSKKKSSKDKSTDYAKPFPSHAPARIPPVSNGAPAPRPAPVQSPAATGLAGFGGNGAPRIPRATTNEGWDRNPNLEMMPSNSRQNLIPAGRSSQHFDDHNNMNGNLYSRPMRPQNNPYAVGRPQVNNPYTSGQGHRNPYYSHDDGKRY